MGLLTTRRSLRARELRLDQREAQLRAHPTIHFGGQGQQFAGLDGDPAHAQNIFDNVKGTASQAQRVIADRVKSLEKIVVIQRLVNGEVEEIPAPDHMLQALLNNPTGTAASGEMTHSASQVDGLITQHLIGVGENYQRIHKNGNGTPERLEVAQPGTMSPVIQGGHIAAFRVGSTGQFLRPDEVIRIWTPDPMSLFSARGVMAANAVEIDTDAFAGQTFKHHFKDNAIPKIIFHTDNAQALAPDPGDMEALSLSWKQNFSRRLGRLSGIGAWLKPGWSVTELNNQLDTGAVVPLLEYFDSKVMQAHLTSPTMLGRNVDVNRAAAETARFTFDQNVILPLTLMIAEAYTQQLAALYPRSSDNVRLVVKYVDFISRDKEFLLRQETADLASAVRVVDEVRADRTPALPPAEGYVGSLPIMGFGMTSFTGGEKEPLNLEGIGLDPVSSAPEAEPSGESTEDATPEEERSLPLSSDTLAPSSSGVRTLKVIDALRSRFTKEQEWERIQRREAAFIPRFERQQEGLFRAQTKLILKNYVASQRARIRSGKRINEAPDALAEEVFQFDRWHNLFRVTVEPVRAAAFTASADAATLLITGQTFDLTTAAREILEAQDFAHYQFTNTTTQDNLTSILRQALKDGDSVEETAQRIARDLGTDEVRARRIARTEIADATQVAQIEGYKQTGVVERQQWNTSLDADVRDSHTIEGQTVALGEDFTLDDGDRGAAPGSSSFRVSNRVNCRCFVTPVFIGEDALTADRPAANEAA